MVPGIGVECVCPSGAMLAKAGTVLDVCLVGGESTAGKILHRVRQLLHFSDSTKKYKF